MNTTSSAPYRPVTLGGQAGAEFETLDDGATIIRAREPLGEYPAKLTERLVHWARLAPDRNFVARRHNGGDWHYITYREMLLRVRSIATAIVARPLSVQRPIMILSGNDLEHLQLTLGAMWAGVPVAPVSPAYSLVSRDHLKLRHLVGMVTPGMVFASNGTIYSQAIRDAVPKDVEVVVVDGEVVNRTTTRFDTFADIAPSRQADTAQAATHANTIAKFLFTSGSTKLPKAVPNTHRMLCSNQQMLLQAFPFFADTPPVIVDWLPWNHTFGGNHNVGLVLYNGGTLYIDDGKPTPDLVGETLRNLHQISPTVHFNVPKGWEDLASAMESDFKLRETFFSRVEMFFYAGAGLSQPVWDQLERQALETCGARIRMITGLGMTETAPSSTFTLTSEVHAGYVGLPCAGCETKLFPVAGKLEARFRGPHVMLGYWRMPELDAEAFDEDGYYRTGDALTFVDDKQPELGLFFDGRISEDFKLSSGTFVSVGPLRARVVTVGSPYVLDAVVTGLNHSDVGLLIFPRFDSCAKLAGLPQDAASADIVAAPAVRARFQNLADYLYQSGTGTASRVARMRLLAEPPSLDRGEITDKGSINQRAVLASRTILIDQLHAGTHPDVILPKRDRESESST